MSDLSWQWQPVVLALLLILAAGGGSGWLRLRRSASASGWRLFAYFAGLIAVAIVLLSPLHQLGNRLFSAHMIGHDLLLLVAAPLLTLADPVPLLTAAMSAGWREIGREWSAPNSVGRRFLKRVTSLRVAWLLYLAMLGLWHSPGAYSLTVRYPGVRWLEHVTILTAASLFWWHVMGKASSVHGVLSYSVRIGLVLSAYVVNQVFGVILVLAGTSFYPSDPETLRMFGITAVQDQTLGGGVMWVPGELVYAGTIFVLVMHLVDEEEPVRGVAELYPRESADTDGDAE